MTDSRIGKTMKVTAEQFESLSEVNRISALKIGEQQAEIDELANMLELYVNGGSDLITEEEKKIAIALIAKRKGSK